MGKLIVFEGLDGSGKATQANLFCNYLKDKGENVRHVTFPNYESLSGKLVRMYLDGGFGTNVNDVNAYAASSFFSVDRFTSYKSDWAEFYNSGGIVIADRYTTSNAVHQCSKLPKDEWDAFLNWLFDFEYERIAIPKPDKVVFLDVETSVSQDLMTKRYSGTDMKKDIHESDIEYLNKSYTAAQYCKEKYGWLHIQCSKKGVMRSIDVIHKDIIKVLKEI